MTIKYEGHVVYKEGKGGAKLPLTDADFGSGLVDVVTTALSEGHDGKPFEGVACFGPKRRDVFGKIDKTPNLAIFCEDSSSDGYRKFAIEMLSHHNYFREGVMKGNVVLECASNGRVQAKSPILGLKLNIGD